MQTEITEISRMLCDQGECTFPDCPDEPCHCEYGLDILQARAELRAELSRDKECGL